MGNLLAFAWVNLERGASEVRKGSQGEQKDAGDTPRPRAAAFWLPALLLGVLGARRDSNWGTSRPTLQTPQTKVMVQSDVTFRQRYDVLCASGSIDFE